jgi:hypothetical protein
MARANIDDVKNILDTNLDDNEIDSFITTANLQVDDTLSNSGLSSEKLTEIEKYLAAHFIVTTRERQASREEVDNARIDYAGNYGKYLEMSSYGQQVIMLDTTGKLAESGKRKAGIWSIDSKY